MISLDPLAAQTWPAVEPVAEVSGQVSAQRGGVPVRVAVQRARHLRDRGGDRGGQAGDGG